MEKTKAKWKGRTGGGQFGQWFLLTTLAHIDVRFFYPILYLVIPFYLLFGWKNARVTFEYFHIRQQYSWMRSLGMTFRNYICFGKVVLDKFAVAAGRPQQFEIEVEGEDYMMSLLNNEKGFILASAHVGNFELAGHCLSQNRKQVFGIVYGGENNKYMQKRMESFKETHVTLISVEEDMSHLFAIKDALDGGNIVSLQCDRIFGNSAKHIVTLPFLNGDAQFPLGVFRIASQLEVGVLSVFALKVSNRRYKVIAEPLMWDDSCKNSIQQSKNLCHQYVDKLEKIIKKYPIQWFNYYKFWEK